MPDPTFVGPSTTLTFRPGQIQALNVPRQTRQRRQVSTNGTVRVIEPSADIDVSIVITVVSLQLADEGIYEGKTTLDTFILTELNWAENTFTFNDSDGDAFTNMRFWDGVYDLAEFQQGLFQGVIVIHQD